jgi:hypothetical protein
MKRGAQGGRGGGRETDGREEREVCKGREGKPKRRERKRAARSLALRKESRGVDENGRRGG